jgi:hypothetical protein
MTIERVRITKRVRPWVRDAPVRSRKQEGQFKTMSAYVSSLPGWQSADFDPMTGWLRPWVFDRLLQVAQEYWTPDGDIRRGAS